MVSYQYREGCLIHLDASPVGRTVEPHVLEPVSILLLSGHQIQQGLLGVRSISRSNEPASRVGKVSWPDQMVSADIIIAFAESPGYREAGGLIASGDTSHAKET